MDNVAEPLSLFSLNNMVRGAIASGVPGAYWVTGELSEVRETSAGHCYIELVERSESARDIVAKARGTIWSRIYTLLKPYFLEQTGEPFAAGLKVLLKVTVVFHELYSYSLDVCDIEPSFTVGDIARQRQLILARLTAEGVINLNKELPFPALPQRVAVISSSFAAGYGDFCDQLLNNPYGFVFYPALFPSPMQGNKVEQGIIAALDKIAENAHCWDVVVIIRGGGATSELSCFDTYDLANNCAQFPLPIITGIGHHRDDTLIDAVAHTRVKTPTAAAELLVQSLAAQEAALDYMQGCITQAATDIADACKRRMAALLQQLPVFVKMHIDRQLHKLDVWQKLSEAASPARILSMGYTLTRAGGKVVRSASDIKPGDEVETLTADGKFISIVKEKTKDNE